MYEFEGHNKERGAIGLLGDLGVIRRYFKSRIAVFVCRRFGSQSEEPPKQRGVARQHTCFHDSLVY
jgi:hypothetical protein